MPPLNPETLFSVNKLRNLNKGRCAANSSFPMKQVLILAEAVLILANDNLND